MQDGCDQDRRARASKPSDARCWNATCSSSFPVRSLRKAGTCSSARLVLPGATSWNPRSDSRSTHASIPPRDNATPILDAAPSWSATTVQWFGAVTIFVHRLRTVVVPFLKPTPSKNCPYDCPCEPPKQRLQSQREPNRSIGEVVETVGFARKNEVGREAAFRLANRRLQPLGHLTVSFFANDSALLLLAAASVQFVVQQFAEPSPHGSS
jgi:hypothetical protein